MKRNYTFGVDFIPYIGFHKGYRKSRWKKFIMRAYKRACNEFVDFDKECAENAKEYHPELHCDRLFFWCHPCGVQTDVIFYNKKE